MLGRLASRFAAKAPTMMAPGAAARSRGFASKSYDVAMPKVLSTRFDSLMMQCTIAAVMYFVPQDLVFLAGVGWIWHTKAKSISPCKKQADAAAAVEEFKAKKGIDSVKVTEGRTWRVSF